jgi:hypothetical protein
LLEELLSHLEKTSFGIEGFRDHVHRVVGTTVSESEHVHRVDIVKGPPWPGPGGHTHRLLGETDLDDSGHSHQIRGWTRPSSDTSIDHTHQIELQTREIRAHGHKVQGTTASYSPDRWTAMHTRVEDGLRPK